MVPVKSKGSRIFLRASPGDGATPGHHLCAGRNRLDGLRLFKRQIAAASNNLPSSSHSCCPQNLNHHLLVIRTANRISRPLLGLLDPLRQSQQGNDRRGDVLRVSISVQFRHLSQDTCEAHARRRPGLTMPILDNSFCDGFRDAESRRSESSQKQNALDAVRSAGRPATRSVLQQHTISHILSTSTALPDSPHNNLASRYLKPAQWRLFLTLPPSFIRWLAFHKLSMYSCVLVFQRSRTTLTYDPEVVCYPGLPMFANIAGWRGAIPTSNQSQRCRRLGQWH